MSSFLVKTSLRTFYILGILTPVILGNIINSSCENVDYRSCGAGDSTICISKDWWCDGHPDCDSGSDEENCGHLKCLESEFLCATGQHCIPSVLRCDGVEHCIDRSDESGCAAAEKSNSASNRCDPLTEFDCRGDGNECVALVKVCDGRVDCTRRQDETPGGDRANCERNDCALGHNGGCSHSCINRFQMGSLCSCPVGLTLTADNKTCLDVDECASWPPPCSGKCVNRLGGYNCICEAGFRLDPNDAGRCLSQGTREIFFSSKGAKLSVFRLSITNSSQNPIHVMLDSDIVNFAADVRDPEKRLYVLQTTPVERQCSLVELQWKGERMEKVLHELNNTLCYGVAFDWLHRLIFWSSRSEGRIYVTNATSGDTSVLLSQDGSRPHQLVVDPASMRIYWLDMTDDTARIETILYDGTGRRTLLKAGLRRPTSLTLDLGSHRLYWADVKPGSISFIQLVHNGSAEPVRTVIIENQLLYPYSITVLEDKIFWADWRQNEVFSIHKSSGHQISSVARVNKPYTVFAHDISVQPLSRPSSQQRQPRHCQPGGSHNCSHICLPSAQSPSRTSLLYRCLCPVGFVLSSNQRICTIVLPQSLKYPENVWRRHIIIGVLVSMLVVVSISVIAVVLIQVRLHHIRSRPFLTRRTFREGIVAGDLMFIFKCSSRASQLSELLNTETNTASMDSNTSA